MITLDAALTAIRQPVTVRHYTKEVQTDAEAIDGSQQRNYIGAKKMADLSWKGLLPAEYTAIYALVAGAIVVAYLDTLSGVTFNGLATPPDPSEYWQGASLLRDLTLTIGEV